MFEQHVLACVKFIGRFSKLVGDAEQGCFFSAIVDASVTVPRYSKLEIERTIAVHCEPKIRRHDYIAVCCGHPYFDRSAVER